MPRLSLTLPQQRLRTNRIRRRRKCHGYDANSCIRQQPFHQHSRRSFSHLRLHFQRPQMLGRKCKWPARHRNHHSVAPPLPPSLLLLCPRHVICSRSATPVQPLASAATSLSAGAYFTCATTSTGVSCWGQNNYGQVPVACAFGLHALWLSRLLPPFSAWPRLLQRQRRSPFSARPLVAHEQQQRGGRCWNCPHLCRLKQYYVKPTHSSPALLSRCVCLISSILPTPLSGTVGATTAKAS